MPVDISHLLVDEGEPDTVPKRQPLPDPIRVIGAEGIIVTQGEDGVLVAQEDQPANIQGLDDEDISESDPFEHMGFRVSFVVEDGVGTATIKRGHFSHVTWNGTTQAWVNEETTIAEYTLTNPVLPALIYVHVPMKTNSDTDEIPTGDTTPIGADLADFQTADDEIYLVQILYSTDWTGLDLLALATSTTLVRAHATPPVADSSYHRLIARINVDETVEQYAFGDFVLPQTFVTRINSFTVT